MTINGTMSMRNPMNVQNIDRRRKPVYCIDNGKRWESAVDCANEFGIHAQVIRDVCNGRHKTYKKLHFSYEENVSETQSKLAERVSTLESNRSELERKAALWDAYEKEQECIRKAEEARQERITKAKAKLERRKRIEQSAQEKYQMAIARRQEAERELAELEGNVSTISVVA